MLLASIQIDMPIKPLLRTGVQRLYAPPQRALLPSDKFAVNGTVTETVTVTTDEGTITVTVTIPITVTTDEGTVTVTDTETVTETVTEIVTETVTITVTDDTTTTVTITASQNWQVTVIADGGYTFNDETGFSNSGVGTAGEIVYTVTSPNPPVALVNCYVSIA